MSRNYSKIVCTLRAKVEADLIRSYCFQIFARDMDEHLVFSNKRIHT